MPSAKKMKETLESAGYMVTVERDGKQVRGGERVPVAIALDTVYAQSDWMSQGCARTC